MKQKRGALAGADDEDRPASAASSEPTHISELPGGVAPERRGASGGRVAPVAVSSHRGRVRWLAPAPAAGGAGPDERAQAHGEPRDPVPAGARASAAAAVPAPVVVLLLLSGRRRRGEPPAAAAASG